ncbi:MAG: quinone-dependent dihydroorotate dehydrogenase [Natrialbaceae archaeon]|nr:quinone-dependent dihydroorotate dehydrogenase [Natrialbaceae archaeon]
MRLYEGVRPVLFQLPPERAHSLVSRGIRLTQSIDPLRSALARHYRVDDPALSVECLGMRFRNPVGVAAGFDKNAEMTHGLASLGFGFIEVGTVTPAPQSGNERPRLFRIQSDQALINRLGFNGDGAERVRDRLQHDERPPVPLGINVGKMNNSDETAALNDYRYVVQRLAPFADYLVVNVSCPNTPDSFDEDSPAHLEAIFETLEPDLGETPLLVKVGPDAPEASLRDLLEIVEDHDVDGIIATNTTTDRPTTASAAIDEWGGLSGKPLQDRSTAVIRTIAETTDLDIIGVGGVDSAETAYAKIRAGASLVQVYTGFVYQGPSTARTINRGLLESLERDGFESIEEAVGADIR